MVAPAKRARLLPLYPCIVRLTMLPRWLRYPQASLLSVFTVVGLSIALPCLAIFSFSSFFRHPRLPFFFFFFSFYASLLSPRCSQMMHGRSILAANFGERPFVFRDCEEVSITLCVCVCMCVFD